MKDVEQGPTGLSVIEDVQPSGSENDADARREALRKAGEAYFHKGVGVSCTAGCFFTAAFTPYM